MPDVYGHLGKYTDIDKDILQLENIKKNLLMKGRKPNASGGLAYMLGEPTYAEGGRIPYQTGGTPASGLMIPLDRPVRPGDPVGSYYRGQSPTKTGTTTVMPLHQAPTVMPPLQQVRRPPVETTQDVVVDTAAGPFAGAKTAAITEAQGRKMPFENYYVGANPTAEQAAFMQKQGAVPFHQRMRKGLYDVLSDAASLGKISQLEAQYNQGKNLPTATGIISDARHQTSLSQLRDTIANQLALTPEGPGAIAKTVGGIGALGAGVINELGQLVTKPSEAIEDLKSNWQGVITTPYGQTPEQTYSQAIEKYTPQKTTEEIARDSQYGDAAATPTPDVTKPIMADVAGPAIPEYYKNNPNDYDYDKFKQAYAKALDARYGTGQGGGTTTIGPEGQIQTSFGSWDPSRTYSAYRGDTRTSGSGPFYDPNNPDDMTMASVMKSMYGAPGAGKAYFNSGGLAGLLGE